ncbi:hypothetical protein Tco_1151302, partial [Tanacetum coccineum]
GSLLALKCLVWFMKYYANVRRTVVDFSHAPLNEYSPSPDDKKQWSLGCWFKGKPIQKLRQKGIYEESFSRHAAWIGGKLIQLMHTTMVSVQVSRPGELRRHLQLWKRFGICVVFVPDRNINLSRKTPKKKDVGLEAGLEAVEKKLEKDGTYSSREQGEAD